MVFFLYECFNYVDRMVIIIDIFNMYLNEEICVFKLYC